MVWLGIRPYQCSGCLKKSYRFRNPRARPVQAKSKAVGKTRIDEYFLPPEDRKTFHDLVRTIQKAERGSKTESEVQASTTSHSAERLAKQ